MTTTYSQTVMQPWLTPVRLVSTSNVSGTYYNGASNNGVGATLTVAASSLTIDSVACAVGDRVLLQTQTNTYEQGIYVVDSIGSTVVLVRSDDQQSVEQYKAGQYVSVGAGSVNAGNAYVLVETLPQAIGSDAITWNSQPGAGAVTFSGGASAANELAVFSDTSGNLKTQTTTSTLAYGLTAATGNFTLTLGSYIADAGDIYATAGDVYATAGDVYATAGNVYATAGNLYATAGDLIAGSSGNAGTFISWPATAANGTLIVAAANAGADFDTTISNAASVGQDQVVSIPDVGAATGNFLATGSALVSGNFPMASGTGGLMVDSGLPAVKGLQYVSVTMSAAEFNGAYATPHLLLAAQGANTIISLEGAYLLMTYATTQFANGGVAAIQYDSTIHGAGVLVSTTQAAANFFDAASTALYFNPGVVKQPFTTAVNKGLYFSNLTGAFDTGDSTFVWHIWYRVLPTV